jgi:Flp pilus assembly pilin Flp
MVEYMVLAAAIALASIYAITSFSSSTKDSFCLAASRLEGSETATSCVAIEQDDNSPSSPCTIDCSPDENQSGGCPAKRCDNGSGEYCSMKFVEGRCVYDCSMCTKQDGAAPNQDDEPEPSIPPPPDCYVGYTRQTCMGHSQEYCLKVPSYIKETNSWTCSDDCSNCPPDPSAPILDTYP